MRRRVLGRFFLVLVSALIAAAIGILATRWWLRTAGIGVERLPPAVVNQEQFIAVSFADFLRALEQEDSAAFPAVSDANRKAMLSRKLFLPTEMFGEPRFRYRPGMAIINTYVWTGVGYRLYCVPATPAVEAALERCEKLKQIRFVTDERGFKRTPPAKGRAVFLLGDSFTEGLFVAADSVFASILGRLLPDAATYNLGVNGYSALEMAWLLEEFAPRLRPRTAIANLFPNDVYWDYLAVVDGRVAPAEGFAAMFRYLARMNEYCRRHDIKFIVSIIPSKEQLDRPETEARFQAPVKAWGAAQGVTVLDPLSRFRALGEQRVYLDFDGHFSEEGHQHYAEFLARNIPD